MVHSFALACQSSFGMPTSCIARSDSYKADTSVLPLHIQTLSCYIIILHVNQTAIVVAVRYILLLWSLFMGESDPSRSETRVQKDLAHISTHDSLRLFLKRHKTATTTTATATTTIEKETAETRYSSSEQR
jgi:hypothetical protein